MKREIAKSRPESRPRILGFMFELSNFAQTRSLSRREYFYSVRDPARTLSRPIHTPPQQPTGLKSLELCVQWRFWDLSRTCGDHMVTLVRGEVTPPPIPSPPLIPPILPPPLPPPHPTFPTFSESQRLFPETVFINVCGAQELPRNEFRQPM